MWMKGAMVRLRGAQDKGRLLCLFTALFTNQTFDLSSKYVPTHGWASILAQFRIRD